MSQLFNGGSGVALSPNWRRVASTDALFSVEGDYFVLKSGGPNLGREGNLAPQI
jgi:hypothetical protein